MKRTYYKVIVIFMISILISGCLYKSVPKEIVKIQHNLTIVPFKAAPIKMISWGGLM
jgi:hypothetical protein